MSTSGGPKSRTKPLRLPVGVAEAQKKLVGLQALGESGRSRRLQQAAYDLACATTWAETAARELPPSRAGWLDEVCRLLRRAERQLVGLAADDSGRVDWRAGLQAVDSDLARVAERYREAAEAPLFETRLSPPAGVPTPAEPGTEDAFRIFTERAEGRGLRAALAYLVQLTDFRHIGLWKFDGGSQSPYAYYDREHPEATEPTIAEDCSGCCHVRTHAGITTLDVLLKVSSRNGGGSPRYHSEPIIGAAGDLLATLCLHDARSETSIGRHAGLVKRVRSYLEQTWPQAITVR